MVGWIEASLDFGQTVDDLRSFISVESTVYAQLGEYYDERMAQVLDQWEQEHRDDDDDDTDDERDDDNDGDDGIDDAPVTGAVPSAEAPVALSDRGATLRQRGKGPAATRTNHLTTGGSIAEPMTAAQLLSKVERYQYPTTSGWAVQHEHSTPADGPTALRCSADWSKPWRVVPMLSAAELVYAIGQASTAEQGLAFAVEDVADMRAAAEGQLLAMLQRGIAVLFVSDHAVEQFPDDDADLSFDMELLSDEELEALAFEPGAIDEIATEL